MKTVAFTGYRLEKMPFAEDITNAQYTAFRAKLREVIDRLIENGYVHYISGVAVGFDTWAAEEVLAIKNCNQTIHLECAIPFPEQDRKWQREDRERRKAILKNSDLNTEVCSHYHKNCFFIRNEYMAL